MKCLGENLMRPEIFFGGLRLRRPAPGRGRVAEVELSGLDLTELNIYLVVGIIIFADDI